MLSCVLQRRFLTTVVLRVFVVPAEEQSDCRGCAIPSVCQVCVFPRGQRVPLTAMPLPAPLPPRTFCVPCSTIRLCARLLCRNVNMGWFRRWIKFNLTTHALRCVDRAGGIDK